MNDEFAGQLDMMLLLPTHVVMVHLRAYVDLTLFFSSL